jgi:hypothetical protein
MPDARPPASIAAVMPLYNKARHVEAALASIRAQTAGPDEIIVVDDGSSDDSLARVRAVADARIRILQRTEPGPGGYAARNLAIAEARAEWIAFLDADDLWRADHLAHIVAAASRTPGAGGVFVGYDNDFGGRLVPAPAPSCLKDQAPRPVDFALLLRAWLQIRACPIWTGACAFRRDALLEAGLFPAGRAARGGDKDLWLRLGARVPLAYSPGRTAIFSRASDNKVTHAAPTNSVPFLCGTIAALAADEPRPDIRRLLRALMNLEIALYARQAFAKAPIPRAMRTALALPEGWRDWLVLAGMEATPAPIARLVRRSLRGPDNLGAH